MQLTQNADSFSGSLCKPHSWFLMAGEVFSEIEPIIKSALDGYNACIFAYGQTGTGKTFTMVYPQLLNKQRKTSYQKYITYTMFGFQKSE